MTDAEIIKAYEDKVNLIASMTSVYLDEEDGFDLYTVMSNALDLVKRKDAEIERLEKEQKTIAKRFYKEGIKDAKKKLPNITVSAALCRNCEAVVRRTDIDELFKKLTGDDNG